MHLFSSDGWLERWKANKKIIMQNLKNAGHAELGRIFHTQCIGQPGKTCSSPVGRGAQKENFSQIELVFRSVNKKLKVNKKFL